MGFLKGLFGKTEKPTPSVAQYATNNPSQHFEDINQNQRTYENIARDDKTRREYNDLLNKTTVQKTNPITTNQGPYGMYPEMRGVHLYARSVMELEGQILPYERRLNNTAPTDPNYESIRSALELLHKQLNIAKKNAYDAFKEKSFTFKVPPQANQIKVYDRIVNFPCLQELRSLLGIGTMTGLENEQQPAHWDPVQHRLSYVVDKGSVYTNASDEYYRYWGGMAIPDHKKVLLTKYGALEIPDCRSLGFPTTCRKKDCESKWEMFATYFKEKQKSHGIDAMTMVTHHNRMVSVDKQQGLIPLAEGFKHMKLANLFTLLIQIEKQPGQLAVVNCKVFVKGFPDKGHFASEGLYPTDMSPSGPIVGGSLYVYVDDDKYLNTEPIRKGIQNAFEINEGFKGMMTLSRHGNAIHNKPANVREQARRTDSSLTLLGVLQAKMAGTELIPILTGKNVMLVTSFLGRTQLTGSLMLQYAGATMNPNMLQFIEYMKHQSYYRFFDAGKTLDLLKVCSPFGDKNYEHLNPSGLFAELEEEAYRYRSVAFPTRGGFLHPHRRKTRRKLSKKIIKKSKTRR
jgi:hypothetical protein